ncbi:MAG: hypothetical protein EXR91_07685 [Gemmatimonadetes bacterium]|nr:hypothetical protein [Gemmatimonadota bacterium]
MPIDRLHEVVDVEHRLAEELLATLLDAAQEAVSTGRAQSVSSWVSVALAERMAKERRLSALADGIETYEAEHGEISEQEMVEQARADRTAAVVVRGSGDRTRARKGREGAA